MIEVKNNQCVILSDLHSVPYEYFYENVCAQNFRCMNIAGRKNSDGRIDVYALFVSASNTLYLEYIELDTNEVYKSIGKAVPSWVNFERELGVKRMFMLSEEKCLIIKCLQIFHS